MKVPPRSSAPPWPTTAWLVTAIVCTALWDLSGLDIRVMQSIGGATGFALQHHWLMERVLHQGMRQVATVVFVGLWVWALWPGDGKRLPRRERLTVAVLVALSLLAVSLIKNASHTSCPWDWRMFGGVVNPVSHWHWGLNDGGPGRCFPGGHASSAFGFLALSLPWLAPPADAQRRRAVGLRWLGAVLLLGLLSGAVQTLRGAHPPSHTLWTLLICGAVSLAGWRALHATYRRNGDLAPGRSRREDPITSPAPGAAAGTPACR